MSESLFSKLYNKVVGTAHDFADKTEDVGSTARQTVREIDNEIGKAEEGLIGVQAEYNSLIHKRDAAQTNVDKFAQYAAKAVSQGNDALALSAFTDKNVAAASLESIQKQVDAYAPTVATLKAQIDALTTRKDAMARDANLIDARSSVAKAQDHAATIIGGIGNGSSATQTFSRLEEKVAMQEATAQAKMQRVIDKTVLSPEDKYATLDTTGVTSAQAQLAAAKAAMGK